MDEEWFQHAPIIQVVCQELNALYAQEKEAVMETKRLMKANDGIITNNACPTCCIPINKYSYKNTQINCGNCGYLMQCMRPFCTPKKPHDVCNCNKPVCYVCENKCNICKDVLCSKGCGKRCCVCKHYVCKKDYSFCSICAGVMCKNTRECAYYCHSHERYHCINCKVKCKNE